MSNLQGLALTKPEQRLILTLSWIFTVPIIYKHCRNLFVYLYNTRQQRLREEQELRERREELIRAVDRLDDVARLR